jgi:hypothetical protein
MAKARMPPAPTGHGPAVLANISRLRSASERARCLIGPHRASHQLAADHLVRGEARLLHRPGGIADALALRQESPLARPRQTRAASSPEEWPESGRRSGIWCLAHAVDERAERPKRP